MAKKYIDADKLKAIEERLNEVRTYLKEQGYNTFLRERSEGQYRLDIIRHEDDFWKSEEYKRCQEILGDNYYEGYYGSDTYSLYIKLEDINMSTNNILSKIRQEIERHLERATAEQEKFPDMPKYRWYLREGKKELCNDLLDYMYDALGVEEPITDSLQPEQSCEDLTTEIEKYFQVLWPGTETAEQCNTDMHFTPPAIMRLAKHFYELGRNNK